jgi:sigma-B regulation protein RsbU (phosphoserine phosphatase)
MDSSAQPSEQQSPDQHRLRQENAALAEELLSLRHFIRSLQDLADAADRRATPADTMDLMRQILAGALAAIGAEDGSLLILDEDTGDLVFVLAHGKIPEDALFGVRIPRGEGIAGWVVERGEPTIVEDARADARFYPAIDEAFGFETRSVLCAPIAGGGRVLGVVEILNKEQGRSFSPDDLALVSLLCRFAGELLHSTEARISLEGPGAEGESA